MAADHLDFFATTAKGMEGPLAEELRSFGASEVKETRAGVAFSGPLEVAYRACLWSRIANRVLLPLKTFDAPDTAKLYGGVKSIRWSDHLSARQTIAVDFALANNPNSRTEGDRHPPRAFGAASPAAASGRITHAHYGALKVKDAIVDQLRSIHGERPSVDPVRPDVRVNVHLHNDRATVSIDLSGDSLHKRGYRIGEARDESGAPTAAALAPPRAGSSVIRRPGTRIDRSASGPAPLKENLAAAILYLGGWPALAKSGGADVSFLDPMCGTGTLAIEAAMIAADRAPGLHREYYGFLGWLGHKPTVWKRLLEEAKEREICERKRLPKIIGTDRDFRAVRSAIASVERAGFTGRVHIEKREFADAQPPSAKGLIAMNPPYGERLGDVESLGPLYSLIGDVFKRRFAGWDGYVFTGSPELSKQIGLKANRRFVLFNGAIECRLFRFSLY